MSKLFKSLVAGTVLSVGLAIGSAGEAKAVSLTGSATITADNHYGFFYGDKDGNSLNFVGRNELGAKGSEGTYNWSRPESWKFNVDSQDYLYMVVWDDQSVDETWLGEFNFSTGQSGVSKNLLSKATDWEYMISKSANPFSLRNTVKIEDRDKGFLAAGDKFEGNVPKNGELAQEIQTGNWIGAINRGANIRSTGPWGQIAGISQNAQFLNVTTADRQQRGTSKNTNYTIFRTRSTVGELSGLPPKSVPEPTTAFGLAALGLIGATSLKKRKVKLGY